MPRFSDVELEQAGALLRELSELRGALTTVRDYVESDDKRKGGCCTLTYADGAASVVQFEVPLEDSLAVALLRRLGAQYQAGILAVRNRLLSAMGVETVDVEGLDQSPKKETSS